MKHFNRFIFSFFFFAFVSATPLLAQSGEDLPRYAYANVPTPVLNTPDFRSVFGGADGKTLLMDDQGLIRAVEFVAMPGTVFYIEEGLNFNGNLIFKVNTADYPAQASGLYVDSRFVSLSFDALEPRSQIMPPKNVILDRMFSRRGSEYIWGGNTAQGIPQLLEFYSPAGSITQTVQNQWALRGLDCSGLLYEATDGATPRNTSDLIHFGQPIAIQGLTAKQIAKKLQPLDFIVWKGHIIYVLNQNQTIESCIGCSPEGGVTVRNLKQVLDEVMKTRTPVNFYPTRNTTNQKPFVIRRWVER